MLVTLTHADEGTASVAGHDVLREPNAVRRSIGYVPQDSGVDQYGTGRENLMLQGRVQGMGGRGSERCAPTSCCSSSGSPKRPTGSSRRIRAA